MGTQSQLSKHLAGEAVWSSQHSSSDGTGFTENGLGKPSGVDERALRASEMRHFLFVVPWKASASLGDGRGGGTPQILLVMFLSGFL